MFALDCRRANGTNLGTCVDHFFFGSCCRLPQGTKDGTTDRSTATPLTTVVRTGILLSNEIIPSTPSISSSKWPQMHSAATTIETTTSTPQTDDIQSLFTTLSSEWKMSSSTMSELDNETVVGHIDSNAIITDSKTWSVPTTTVTTVKPLVTSQQSYHSIVTSEPTSTLDNYVTETLPSSERITTTSSGSIDDADTSLPWTSSETEQVSVTLSEYWPTATTTMILTTSTDIVSATSNPTTTTTTTTTTEQEVTTKSSTLPLTIPSSTTIVNTVTTTTENVTETPSSTAPPTTPEEPFDFDTLSETDYTTGLYNFLFF